MEKEEKQAASKKPAALVKARVREGVRYGGLPTGTIVEVEEKELRIASKQLISLEEEALLKREADKPKELTPSQNSFRMMRDAMVAGAERQDAARKEQMRKQLEMLGLTVVAK
jgi:NADH dehydrogenase/NADH:ubiquinone oxidoreductase subunit G